MFYKKLLLFILLIPSFINAVTNSNVAVDCTFCNINARTEHATIIAENKDVLVFESIRPRYPSHWLIVPKKHVENVKSAATDNVLLGKLFAAAGALGKQLDGTQSFNLHVNEGSDAGQTVFHLHVHFYSHNKLKVKNPQI